MAEIVKGFQTDSGIAYYDYNFLENKPDLSIFLEESEISSTPAANKILRLNENAALPADITGKAAEVDWSGVTGKPDSLEGFGLTDEVYNKEEVQELIKNIETSGSDFALALSEHNTSPSSHEDIRILINELTSRLNTIADSDDITLDQLSELVAYIKDNRELIGQITSNKINVSDIINNLTTNVSDKPLSAAQGVVLKGLIDAIIIPTKLSDLIQDSEHRTVTDAEKEAWNKPSIEIEVDTTLTQSGMAADSQTVGDRLNALSQSIPTNLSQLNSDSEHRTVTDAEKEKWNSPTIELDTTLTESGKAADALTVGQEIKKNKYTAHNEQPETTEGLWIDLDDNSYDSILDETLTQEGWAADARATGAAIKEVKDLAEQANSAVNGIDFSQFLLLNGNRPMNGILNLNNFKIINLAEPISDLDAVNKKYIDDRIAGIDFNDLLYIDGSTSMTGNLNLGSNKITNLAAPIDETDAVNKIFAINASNLTSGTINTNVLPIIPLEKGGTNSDNGMNGLANLFAAGPAILSENQYGDTLPEANYKGRIFFKRIVE